MNRQTEREREKRNWMSVSKESQIVTFELETSFFSLSEGRTQKCPGKNETSRCVYRATLTYDVTMERMKRSVHETKARKNGADFKISPNRMR